MFTSRDFVIEANDLDRDAFPQSDEEEGDDDDEDASEVDSLEEEGDDGDDDGYDRDQDLASAGDEENEFRAARGRARKKAATLAAEAKGQSKEEDRMRPPAGASVPARTALAFDGVIFSEEVVQETVLALGLVLPSGYLVYKCEGWIEMFVSWLDSPDLHVKAKAASALANVACSGRPRSHLKLVEQKTCPHCVQQGRSGTETRRYTKNMSKTPYGLPMRVCTSPLHGVLLRKVSTRRETTHGSQGSRTVLFTKRWSFRLLAACPLRIAP